jgi:hypothetical protein
VLVLRRTRKIVDLSRREKGRVLVLELVLELVLGKVPGRVLVGWVPGKVSVFVIVVKQP